MFSIKFFAAAAASLSLISSSAATYDPSSQRNLAMYFGSGTDQNGVGGLKQFCQQSSVDIIPIGFINAFPAQANGLVGETFGDQCWADPKYVGPGYHGVKNTANDILYQQCPYLQEDLYWCQQNTDKKFLLSLGGASGPYNLKNAGEGVELANFLWGAYGPLDPDWKGVRPLDRGSNNNNASMTIEFDGFDFDIEQGGDLAEQLEYVSCVNQLRSLMAAYKKKNPCAKDYIISGAPQCPTDEPYMSTTINQAQFDILFIQFYNNRDNGCNARNYTNNKKAGKSVKGFTYDDWVTKISTGASKNAKLYLGLLGGTAATSAKFADDYITPAEANSLINDFHTHAQFGGVMIYEASVAERNAQFYKSIKTSLNNLAKAGTGVAPKVCTSTTTSTSKTSTSSSTSSSKTTSSSVTTTSSSTTSSSTSKTSTSSSVSSTKTSSSTSSTSSTKTSSSTTSSSPTSSSTSSTSTSSSTTSSTTSSTSSSPTSSSTTSSSTLSSSSSSTLSSTTSTSSTISSTSSSSTSTPTPTTVPSVGSCKFIGCYSEATSVRALSGATYVNPDLMSVEICSEFCATSGFRYFGVEYASECYCGNSFGEGSTLQPPIDCSMTCAGTPTEFCGSGNRLNVYDCQATTSSSSTLSSSTTSSVVSSTSSVATTSSTEVSTSSSVSSTESSTATLSSSTLSSSTSSSTLSSYTDTTSSISSTESSTATLTSSSTISSYTDTSSTLSSSTSSVSSTESSTLSSTTSTYSVSSTESSTSSTVSPTPTSSYYTNSSSSSTIISTSSTLSSSVYYNITSTTSKASVCTRKIRTTSSTGTGIITSSLSSSSSMPYYINSSTTATPTITSSSVYITYTPSSSASTTEYTTSTVYTTSVYTITSCAPTVTNCPAHSTVLTTKTIALYTTVCPVSAVTTPTYTPTSKPVEYTTSTVYATSVYTVTSCAPTVTNCPAHLGSVTTETIALYTTVCPVSATPTYAIPGKGGKPSSAVTYPLTGSVTASADVHKTTTLSSTTTNYVTVVMVKSTATLIPVASSPTAPYPVYPVSSKPSLVGTGTGVPTAVKVTVSVSSAKGSSTSTPVTTYQTGGSGKMIVGRGMSVAAFCVVMGVVLLM